jgi:class 3 adenylate cyclase
LEQWSRSRTGEEVVKLLELTNQFFGEIASQYDLVQVESLSGGSYCAVSGIPVSNRTHATLMARFAFDCQESIKLMMETLSSRFGEDTAKLALKIGLHSGSCQASITQNETGTPRLKVHGDLTKITDLMSSTSEAGKIHISSSTAKLLHLDGKDSRIRGRTGFSQTIGDEFCGSYWLDISNPRQQQDI